MKVTLTGLQKRAAWDAFPKVPPETGVRCARHARPALRRPVDSRPGSSVKALSGGLWVVSWLLVELGAALNRVRGADDLGVTVVSIKVFRCTTRAHRPHRGRCRQRS